MGRLFGQVARCPSEVNRQALRRIMQGKNGSRERLRNNPDCLTILRSEIWLLIL